MPATRRRITWSIVAVGLTAMCVPAQAARTTGTNETTTTDAWTEALWKAPSSGFTATNEYLDGTFVHTEHVFDDKGANVDDTQGGDFTYPADGAPYMRNAADLVELRLRRDGNALSLGARLNTLLDSSVPVVAVGIVDPRRSLSGKALPWPGAGVRASGVRWVVTLRADAAVFTDLRTGTAKTYPLALANNTRTGHRYLENTLSTRLPLSAFDFTKPPRTLRLHAVAGVRDGKDWLRPADGAPAAFDLAFVRNEQWDNWQQNRQADLLASADISSASADVDLTVRTRKARIPTGASTRIYRPSIEQKTGEGIESNAVSLVTAAGQKVTAPLGDHFLGLFLPYAVYIPRNYAQLPKPVPAFLTLHGSGESHQSYLFSNWVDGSFTVPAIAVAPLGRGGWRFYQADSGLDALEALADAKTAYPIDANRVYLTGFSMGGMGTYTLGTQRPDLFAAAIAMSGPGSGWRDTLWPVPAEPVMGPSRDVIPAHRLGSFGRELLDNALNLPFRITQGDIDYLAAVNYGEGDRQRWEELGYDYQYSLFLNRKHEIVPSYVNAIYHRVLHGCPLAPKVPGCSTEAGEASGIVRDTTPARVVYKTVPFHAYPELGLPFDGAYWVSGMKVRDASTNASFGRIDATSLALAKKLRAQTRSTGPELRTYNQTDDNYRFNARIWGNQPKPALRGHITATLQNLSAVTLDLPSMGINPSTPVVLEVTGDGHTVVTLRGPWRAGTKVTVTKDGAQLTTIVAGLRSLRLPADFTGTHRYDLRGAA